MTDHNWPPPSESSSGGPSSDYPPPTGQPVGGDVPTSWAPAPGNLSPGAAPGGATYPPSNPQGYPSGYGMPPGVAAAPARKSRWWIWLLAVFFGLILLVGGCTALVIRAVRGPVDASNEFFAAVNDGDLSRAASLVSADPSCSFGTDPESSIDQQFTGVTVEDYFFAGASVSSSEGGSTAEVIGLVTTLEAGEVGYAVDMIQDGDDWKVCALERTD